MAARARVLLGGLAILSLGYGAVGVFRDAAAEGGFLWDLRYYRTAAARWEEGLDPYLSAGAPTGYFYSLSITPVIAWVFSDFAAKPLYLVLVVAAVAGALALAIRSARPPPGAVGLCWLYAAAFGNAEVLYVVAAGNLAWLVGLLQAGALLAAARGRWTVFYLLVGVTTLVKPYTLLLLVVPLALGALSLRAVIALAPLVVDALAVQLLRPELAASRSTAVWLQVVEPLQLRYSLAGRLSRILANGFDVDVGFATLAAVAAQLAVVGLLVLALRLRPPADPSRAFALAVVAAFAALPRMAGYDAFVFGPAVLVAFLPLPAGSASRGASISTALVSAAGLLKEGLAAIPPLALTAFALSSRRPRR